MYPAETVGAGPGNPLTSFSSSEVSISVTGIFFSLGLGTLEIERVGLRFNLCFSSVIALRNNEKKKKKYHNKKKNLWLQIRYFFLCVYIYSIMLARKVNEFFDLVTGARVLKAIRKEVEDTTTHVVRTYHGQPTQTTRRGRSRLVLDAIHEILGDEHEECHNAEGPCLEVLVRRHMTKTNGMKVIKGLEALLPNLYLNQNVLAQTFSSVNKVIQTKFPESKLAEEAKKRLHITVEAAILRRKNYEAT